MSSNWPIEITYSLGALCLLWTNLLFLSRNKETVSLATDEQKTLKSHQYSCNEFAGWCAKNKWAKANKQVSQCSSDAMKTFGYVIIHPSNFHWKETSNPEYSFFRVRHLFVVIMHKVLFWILMFRYSAFIQRFEM